MLYSVRLAYVRKGWMNILSPGGRKAVGDGKGGVVTFPAVRTLSTKRGASRRFWA
jgi:hypothetical protein